MCRNMAVFQNGDLCISILHAPIDDPQSGELPCERWNPTQSVRYVTSNEPHVLAGRRHQLDTEPNENRRV